MGLRQLVAIVVALVGLVTPAAVTAPAVLAAGPASVAADAGTAQLGAAAAAAQPTTVLTSDFESGTPQGWGARIGSEVVAVTSADAHTGRFSLLTTNRTGVARLVHRADVDG